MRKLRLESAEVTYPSPTAGVTGGVEWAPRPKARPAAFSQCSKSVWTLKEGADPSSRAPGWAVTVLWMQLVPACCCLVQPRSAEAEVTALPVFCAEKEKAVTLPWGGRSHLWDAKNQHDWAHPWSSASPWAEARPSRVEWCARAGDRAPACLSLVLSLFSDSTWYLHKGYIPRHCTSVSSSLKWENCTYLIGSKIKWGNTRKVLGTGPDRK